KFALMSSLRAGKLPILERIASHKGIAMPRLPFAKRGARTAMSYASWHCAPATGESMSAFRARREAVLIRYAKSDAQGFVSSIRKRSRRKSESTRSRYASEKRVDNCAVSSLIAIGLQETTI